MLGGMGGVSQLGSEDLLGMILGAHLLASDDALDLVLRIDDEGRALGPHVLTAVHALLDPSTEELVELDIGVGDEAEGQVILRAEVHMTLGGVTADPDDLVASGSQFAVAVTQAAGLSGAARSVILGVEVKDDLLVWVVRETYFLALLVEAK